MSLGSKGFVSCVLLVSGWWFGLAASESGSAVNVLDPFGLFLLGNMVANVSLWAFVSALEFLFGHESEEVLFSFGTDLVNTD